MQGVLQNVRKYNCIVGSVWEQGCNVFGKALVNSVEECLCCERRVGVGFDPLDS